jgi:hypothetical protein
MARTALSHARDLRQRSTLLAAVGGVGATTVWIALSLLVSGREGDALPQLVVAGVFGLVFFVTFLTVARVQARQLRQRARKVLDDGEEAQRP